MDRITNIPARDRRETLFGACAAIGETIGVNPLWIRLGFLVAVMAVSLKLTVVAYCVAAVAFKLAER